MVSLLPFVVLLCLVCGAASTANLVLLPDAASKKVHWVRERTPKVALRCYGPPSLLLVGSRVLGRDTWRILPASG